MNKIFSYLKLPLLALLIIFLIYNFLSIQSLSSKLNKNSADFTKKLNSSEEKRVSLENQIANFVNTDKTNETSKSNSAPKVLSSITTNTTTAEPVTTTNTITKTSISEVQKNQVTVTIQNVGSFVIDIADNDTSFSALKKAAEQNHFDLKYTEYSFGVFVTSIGGIDPKSNEYWAFYFNGAFSAVGASAQPIQKGDSIFWQLAS